MKIGLIDVDGHHFPNLALMKLAAWHKRRGDTVEWYEPLIGGHYDKVYMSKVFTFTDDYMYPVNADQIEKGGTGYKMYDKDLPEEIESTFPDYSIYPECDYAVGFLTRGCVRNCEWCVVPKKEGAIRANLNWTQIKRTDTKKIRFLDNNVLAHRHGVRQIINMAGRTDIRIDFNQGLDARLITENIAPYLARCKWERWLRVACDSPEMIPVIQKAADLLENNGLSKKKIFCYALIKDVKEAHERIKWLDCIGVEVFAQPYRNFETNEVDHEAKRLARWCNRKPIFRTCTFEEYKRK